MQLRPYTYKEEKETPRPNTHKAKELLFEAMKVKASKKKGSVSRAWELVEEAIAVVASSGDEGELPLFIDTPTPEGCNIKERILGSNLCRKPIL